jgi:hypothetical protein
MNLALKFIVFIAVLLYSSRLVEDTGSCYYDSRVDRNKTTPKVYDILHRYLPDLHEYHYLSDIFTIGMTIPLVFYPYLAEEYTGYWMSIFAIRILSTLCTILPKYKKCSPDVTLFGGCYDKLFSGHFSSGLLATLLYIESNLVSVPVAVLLNFLNGALIVLARSHYTVDIIMAFFVTMFVYQNKLKM